MYLSLRCCCCRPCKLMLLLSLSVSTSLSSPSVNPPPLPAQQSFGDSAAVLVTSPVVIVRLTFPHFKNYCYYMRCSDKNRICPAAPSSHYIRAPAPPPLETAHEIRPGHPENRRESRRFCHMHLQICIALSASVPPSLGCIKNNYNCSHDFLFQECLLLLLATIVAVGHVDHIGHVGHVAPAAHVEAIPF